MASLGFNQQRRQRATNLPGAVGGTVPTVTTPGLKTKRRSPPLEKRDVPPATNSAPAKSSIPPFRQPTTGDHHWVFATTTQPLLHSISGDEAAPAAERVMLVYPMRENEDHGRVEMRFRHVHPVTGQLHDDWVTVYDPVSGTRYVTDFSLRA